MKLFLVLRAFFFRRSRSYIRDYKSLVISSWLGLSGEELGHHSHTLDHHLYAEDTQIYKSLSTATTDRSLTQLGDCLSDISGWMSNSRLKLNADKPVLIIIGTFRKRSKLIYFFSIPSLNDCITPSHTVYNITVTVESDFISENLFI